MFRTHCSFSHLYRDFQYRLISIYTVSESAMSWTADDVFDDVNPTLGAIESCCPYLQLITIDIRNHGHPLIQKPLANSINNCSLKILFKERSFYYIIVMLKAVLDHTKMMMKDRSNARSLFQHAFLMA